MWLLIYAGIKIKFIIYFGTISFYNDALKTSVEETYWLAPFR